MSILVVELVPEGIVFGADRNISDTHVGPVEVLEDSAQGRFIEQPHYHYFQSSGAKILRWPKRKALIGYVGEAIIGGTPSDEWLYDFIGENINFDNFTGLAESLRRGVEDERRKDEGEENPRALIIHLAGFEEREGIQVPAVWVIRNDHDPPYLKDLRKEFLAIDCIWPDLAKASLAPQDFRNHLTERAMKYNPLWFHQGIGLATFNLLEEILRIGLRELDLFREVSLQSPKGLPYWERQVRLSVLLYGAYFQAFKEPFEQDVGGGADVLSIPWPE
ncbi:MAG: hypothetical protein ABI977_27595 [Acidobacteriota bacterium]